MRGILIAVTLILTVLAFYSALRFKSQTIEQDITARVTENIDVAHGVNDISIDVDGRHVTLSGVVYDEQIEADYLQTADTTRGALGPIDGLSLLADGGYVAATKTADGITLRGTVLNEAARASLLASAAAATSGAVDDRLTVSGPVALWQDEAVFGVGQLDGLTTGTMTASNGAFALSGVAGANVDAVTSVVQARDGWQAFISAPGVTRDLSDEVARLNGEVATRDGTIADLTEGLSAKDMDVASLTQERDGVTTELEALRANLTEGQSDTESLRATLNATRGDLDIAKTEIDARDQTIVDLNGQVGALTQQRATLSDDLGRTGRQVTGAEALVAALTTTIADNDTQAASLTGRITELETELANRQVAAGSTDEQVAALNVTVTDLTADIADLSGVVAERDDTIAGMSQAAADTQSRVVALESVIATRDGTIRTLTKTVADTQAQVDTVQASVETRDVTIEALRENSADLSGEIAQRDATIAARDETIVGLRGDIEPMSAEIAALSQNLGLETDRVAERDVTIAALRSTSPAVQVANAEQCAAQAATVMEGSQINFRSGTANIDGGSVNLLERLTGIAMACVGEGGLSLEVGGHTDNQGSDADNQVLSEARARAVMTFMADRGVPTRGVVATGYGESQPIANNDTPAGRAQNRRISFDWQAR